MPRDIIDDPLPHRYRNAAEGGRREAGDRPAGRVAEGDGSGTGGRRARRSRRGRGGTGGGRLAGVIQRNRRA